MTHLHIALKAELVEHSSTGPLIGGETGTFDRFFPLVIPQKRTGGTQQMPCVVFNTQNVERGVSQCGTDGLMRTTFTLDCYALKYDSAKDLALAVREALLDFRGNLGGMIDVRAANLLSEFDLSDIEPGLYRVSQTWAIWHLE